jgi:hypothetical protein
MPLDKMLAENTGVGKITSKYHVRNSQLVLGSKYLSNFIYQQFDQLPTTLEVFQDLIKRE